MGCFSNPLKAIGNIFSEPVKAVTRPLDKLLDTSITKNVDPIILPAIGATIGFMGGGPPGAAIGAGLGRTAGGMSEGHEPERVLKNALYSAGLGYGAGTGLETASGWLAPSAASGAPAIPTSTAAAGWSGITGAAPLTAAEEAAAGWSGITGAAPLATAPPMAAGASALPGATAALPATMGWPEFEAMNAAGQLGGGATTAAPATTGGVWDWIKANPMKAAGAGMLASSVLGSTSQAGMMQDVNQAQQQSYQDYLSAINPPEEVKDVRYDILAEQTKTQANLAQKRLEESLAQRGVRGKGTAAPTGDLAEAERQALNTAYNQIFGTYNVPSTPGPVSYAPSAGELTTSNISQMLAQGIPLALILSKYGVS